MERELQVTRDPERERECATCGHAQRFHEDGDGPEAANQPVCTSPEDGTRCACKGFEPV
jgi:hypothetical protein